MSRVARSHQSEKRDYGSVTAEQPADLAGYMLMTGPHTIFAIEPIPPNRPSTTCLVPLV